MKKCLLTIFACSSLMLLNAQGEFSFGFKAGLNFSTMDGELEMDAQGNALEEVTYSTGFNVGAMLNYSLTDHFGLRTELLYSQKGKVVNYDGPSYFVFNPLENPVISRGNRKLEADIINSYLEIPLLVYAKYGKFEIMGGAYASALIGSVADGKLTYRPANRQGNSFEELEFTLDYRFGRDEAGEATGDVRALTANSKSVDVPTVLGAYYEVPSVDDRLYNILDLGLIGGLSFYLNKGFFINARVEYGLVDVTDEVLDVSLSQVPNTQLIFRNDNDQNFTIHTSVGFRF